MDKRLRYQMIRSAVEKSNAKRRQKRLNVELEKELQQIEDSLCTPKKNFKKL
jgi:hypothetical protein